MKYSNNRICEKLKENKINKNEKNEKWKIKN